MKILALVSALDLRHRLSSTPHWWHLLKALSREGVDLVAVPYVGRAVESLDWRVAENPCQLEGEAFVMMRDLARRVASKGQAASAVPGPTDAPTPAEALSDRLVRRLARGYVLPRWRRLVRRLFDAEKFDAVLVFNLPLNHLCGLARDITERQRVPVWYYDGDLPASLPGFGGFATGFRVWEGADPGEYDGFFVNSEGSCAQLERMGVRRTVPCHWGADLDVYRRLDRTPEIDGFFYGYGEQFREAAMDAMLYEPARLAPELSIAVGGLGFGRAPSQVRRLGDVPFSRFNEWCARARINIVVTRQAHASVFASSSARPFELGAMGCATVSNPWLGLETWFEPGREILVVSSAAEAVDTYRRLLADEPLRRGLGEAMRRRVEAEHTTGHRARTILGALGLGTVSAAGRR